MSGIVIADARVGEYMVELFQEVGVKLEAAAGEPYGFALFTFPLNRVGTFHHMYQGQAEQVAHFLQQQARLICPDHRSVLVARREGNGARLYKISPGGEIDVSGLVDCDLRAFNQIALFLSRCNAHEVKGNG
jgi:hypothetical protein